MSKVFLVAEREYLENVKTKGFWIGIFIFPVLLTAFIVVPALLERTRSARRYAVIDQSGWLLDAVERRVTVSDLTRVFGATVEKYQAGGEEFAQLPAILQQLAPVLAELDPAQQRAFAQRLVADPASGPVAEPAGALPESAVSAIAEQRESVLRWWRGLPGGEAGKLAAGVSRSRYVRVSGDTSQAALNRKIADEELFAYFVIGPDPVSGSEGSKYISNNLTDDALREWFGFQATSDVRAKRLEEERIDPSVARWIQEPVGFEARKVSETGEEQEVEERDLLRQWAPVVFVYLLWISVFTTSQMLLTNTVEEKSNRIIEVLLSSVSPIQLLAGKIAGIAATGLTIVGSWMLMFFFGTKYLPALLGAPASLDLTAMATDPFYVGSFIAYFLLGYLFYSAILVALGSVCNTLKEAQNLMGPVTLFLILPLLAMVPIGQDPNGTLAQALSYFPPFTPFVMMNRAAGPPSTFEYVATTVLLVAAIWAVLWMGAKVFRIGILLTGKPPKLREILRWLRVPVGTVPVRKEA